MSKELVNGITPPKYVFFTFTLRFKYIFHPFNEISSTDSHLRSDCSLETEISMKPCGGNGGTPLHNISPSLLSRSLDKTHLFINLDIETKSHSTYRRATSSFHCKLASNEKLSSHALLLESIELSSLLPSFPLRELLAKRKKGRRKQNRQGTRAYERESGNSCEDCWKEV